MITVSYELAQKMQNKGWKQETEFYYRQSVKGRARHRDTIIEFIDLDVFMSAPTADEIAKTIRGKIIIDIDTEGFITLGRWQAKYPTIAEALGELWCEMKDWGLV